jgi:predicted Zn-dependent protease
VKLNILGQALYAILIFCLALPLPAIAQERGSGGPGESLIRDAEIEDVIRAYATPIFTAAGLDAAAVHIYLVNDSRLNAFVAGGQNLFMFTGTIMRSENPNQLVGIMAHESGHIAGGHLLRTQEAMENASIEGMIAMALGVAAAVVGHGNAGGAVLAGGVGVAQRSFLQYSIEQEAKADQAGLTFLDKTHQSARGLLEFFHILQSEELLSAARQDPYLRTHPLTMQRIEYVQEHVDHSPFSGTADRPDWVELHRRMKAKLAGFLNPPGQSLAAYKENDPSASARYARAVAYYRVPNLQKAVPLIDGLIQDEPKNPYFRELKGQMLFENGHVQEALAPYQEAVRLKPDSALLRIELAQVQIESNDPALNKPAIANLKEAVRFEDRNPMAWRLLAVGYGRQDDIGMSALALSEEAYANGDRKLAIQQADRALQFLPAGAPARLRAEDLKALANRSRDDE